MLEWFLQLIPTPRLELILLFAAVLIFGLIGGIGWITLAMTIKPMKLSAYFASLFSAVAEYWFNNQGKQGKPVSQPDKDTDEIKSAFKMGERWPFSPIPRPDTYRNRGTK